MKIMAYRADDDGCGWHRIILPGMFLSKLPGVTFEHTMKVMLDRIPEYDVLIFQRSIQPDFLPIFEKIRANPNQLLIYEADDAFDLIPKDSYASKFFPPSVVEMQHKLMQTADVLQFSTPFLCDHYGKRFGKPSIFLENQIVQTFEHQFHGEDKIVVGWAGGASHNVDVGILKKTLKTIQDEFPNVHYRIMGASNVYAILRRWGLKNLEYVHWSKDLGVYYQELAKFDIGLAPVLECGFNKAKSTLKFLEYAACGTPMVGSRFLYEQDAVHGETAMLADRPLEWTECLRTLVADQALRREMGQKAQRYIQKNRMHAQHAPYRYQLYQRLLEEKRRILSRS